MARTARGLLIFGGFIAVVGATFYPIYFRPLMHVEEYRKEQAINRAGIIQEDVQPADLLAEISQFVSSFQPSQTDLITDCLRARWQFNH